MGLLQRIFGLSGLCGAAGWAVSGSLKVGAGATGVAFLVLPVLLMKHFSRIHRLRYLEGRVQQALFELAPWRLLIPKPDFVLLKAGMLAHAEMYASVAAMIADAGLAPDRRAHAEFCLYKSQEKWDEAEQALVKALETAQGPMRTACLGDLALLLGEHKLDRLVEAFGDFDEATRFPTVPGIEAFLFGIEGQLWTVGGAPELGIQLLETHLPTIEQKAKADYSMLPVLAVHRRFMARAYWALGQTDRARELMIQSRDTFVSKQWTRHLDADLAKLRDDQPLFDPPTEEVRAFVEERKEGFELRTQWPGGYQAMM